MRASLAALPVGDKVGPAGDGPVPGKSAGLSVVSYAKRNPLIGLARGKFSEVFGRMRIVKSKNGIGQG